MKTLYIYILLTCVFIVFQIIPSRAQWSVDTSKRVYPSVQIESFLTGNQPPFYSSTEISVFGNDDCGHCSHLIKLLKENNIPYLKYDTKENKDYFNLMLELVDKVDKGYRAFYFPVVLVNDKLYYSIFNMDEFVENLKRESSK